MKLEINIAKKHLYYVLGFAVLIFITAIVIAQTSAPNPGHAATEIGEGTIANALTISGGNVGIGTTNPQDRLEVVSGGFHNTRFTNTLSGGNSWDLAIGDNGLGIPGILSIGYIGASGSGIGGGPHYSVLALSPSGNVGIGTTSPGTKLDVSGGVIRALATAAPAAGLGTGMEMFFDSNGPEGRLVSLDRAGAGTYKPIRFGASTYQFDVSAAAKMVLDANGNVGIGTTSPSDKLSVNGDISATGNIKLACTRVTAECTLPATAGGYCSATATCPSGYYIVSGGFGVGKCGHGDEYEVEQSYPLSSTQWFADFSNAGTCTVYRVQTTYAVCCKTASY